MQKKIIDYWLLPKDSRDSSDYFEERGKLWFFKSKDTDSYIKKEFGFLFEDAQEGKLDSWKETIEGKLALVILLDQFSRNIYRGSSKAFSFDYLAQEIALEMIENQEDIHLDLSSRIFIYLPLEHAESISMQKMSVKKCKELVQESEIKHRKTYEEYLLYAEQHLVIIERFGRFPHRNAAIGRPSTQDEIEFLKQPGSSF